MNSAIPNHRPRYATRYEVAATHLASGHGLSVGFTRQVSRSGLLRVLQSRGPELVGLLGLTDDSVFKLERVHGRWTWNVNGWRVGFTGRTELDCARSHRLV